MFLSNHGPGRPSSELYDFKRAHLRDRRRMLNSSSRRRSLLVWFLHDCDDEAPLDPAGTMAAAEVGVEAAARMADADLASWAYSVRGNLSRLLREHVSAAADLEKAVGLAEHPYQKADATGRLGALIISKGAQAGSAEGLLAGIAKVDEAENLSRELPRLYTDRGYTMIRQSKAVGHLHLSSSREGEREVAIQILEEVLSTGDLRHAKRARSAAQFNLAAASLNFAERPPASVLAAMRSSLVERQVKRDSVRGALLRWCLEMETIRRKGYDWPQRKRLLTIRKHLIQRQAWEYASRLSVGIAALDAEHGMRAGEDLLEESVPLLRRGGLVEMAATVVQGDLARERIGELAVEAGLGHPQALKRSG